MKKNNVTCSTCGIEISIINQGVIDSGLDLIEAHLLPGQNAHVQLNLTDKLYEGCCIIKGHKNHTIIMSPTEGHPTLEELVQNLVIAIIARTKKSREKSVAESPQKWGEVEKSSNLRKNQSPSSER